MAYFVVKPEVIDIYVIGERKTYRFYRYVYENGEKTDKLQVYSDDGLPKHVFNVHKSVGNFVEVDDVDEKDVVKASSCIIEGAGLLSGAIFYQGGN
ncbi:MAG: hypothetical protein ACP5QX_06685 [Caldisericaceae bacterium]